MEYAVEILNFLGELEQYDDPCLKVSPSGRVRMKASKENHRFEKRFKNLQYFIDWAETTIERLHDEIIHTA